MLDSKTCRECGGRMARGYVLDYDTSKGMSTVSRWFKGAPVKRWYGLQVKRKEALEVVSYRCDRCGLLQSYVPSN